MNPYAAPLSHAGPKEWARAGKETAIARPMPKETNNGWDAKASHAGNKGPWSQAFLRSLSRASARIAAPSESLRRSFT